MRRGPDTIMDGDMSDGTGLSLPDAGTVVKLAVIQSILTYT